MENLNIIEVAKEALKDKKLIIKETFDGKVVITYKNIGKKTSNHFSSITFPPYIKLDSGLSEMIGYYLGDGMTSELTNMVTQTVSKDADLVRFAINFFNKRLNVPFDKINLIITYWKGDKEEIKKEWSKRLNVEEDKFKVYRSSKKQSETMRVQINSVIFRSIFQFLLHNYLDKVWEDKHLRRGFLRGYFAAEGTISYYKQIKGSVISSISFAYNSPKENWLRDFCMKCLKKEGINVRYENSKEKLAGRIVICNWMNFQKLWDIKIFDRCIRKKKLFMNLVKKPKFYCYLDKNLRENLFDKLSLTQERLAKLIGSTQGNVSEIIKGKRPLEIRQLHILSQFLNKDINFIKENIVSFQIYHSSTKLEPSHPFLELLFKNN